MDRYISIKVIGERLMRNPLLKNINFEALIDYSVDFFRIIGAPRLFIEKTITLDVTNHKVELPCDLVEIIQIQKQGSEDSNGCYAQFKPMRYATSSFRSIYHCEDSPDIRCQSDTTYSVENGYIYTSFCDGRIQIAYRGLNVDKEGFPMLPDNPRVLVALENYIKMQYYTILYEMQIIPLQILEKVEQNYAWTVGAAETELHKMDDATAENVRNIWNRMIWNTTSYSKGFKNIGEQEILQIQP